MDRARGYVDGFNLYHGIKAKGWNRYLWLDIHALIGRFLIGDQELHLTKYCTSRTAGPPSRVKRQATFIDALKAQGGVEVIEGEFQHVPVVCSACGHGWNDYEEKQTDVNVAIELVGDAHRDQFDVAFVVSGDTDLIPAIRAVRALGKRVVCLFPPLRGSGALAQVANADITIGRKRLAESLLPEEVRSGTGYMLKCPESWRAPSEPTRAT